MTITPTELADAVKSWKREHGLTNETAAEALGVPKRTLDEVTRGRGFAYPKLLLLGLGRAS